MAARDRKMAITMDAFYLQTILQHCVCFPFNEHIAKFESLKLLVLVQFDKNALLIIVLQSIFKETARPKEF